MSRVQVVDWLRGPGRRRQWRRRVLRRGLAALCALGAAWGVVAVATSSQERDFVPVVVAIRPMAVGEVATPASVRQVLWPAGLLPADSIARLGDVLGRPVATPLGRGEPVTNGRVRPGSVMAGQPIDAVAVHVLVPDSGSLSMVSAGDRIDLWGPDGPVARSVVVLRVDQTQTTDFGSVIKGPGSSSGYALDGQGLVVSAGQEAARRILGVPEDALGRPRLDVVLTHPWPETG